MNLLRFLHIVKTFLGGKVMKVGDKVIFEGGIYKILYIYPNGYCELRKEYERFSFQLVSIKELQPIKKFVSDSAINIDSNQFKYINNCGFRNEY